MRCRSCYADARGGPPRGGPPRTALDRVDHLGVAQWRRSLRRVHAESRLDPAGDATARLGELEQAGMLERRVVEARPPRAEYRLTARGAELRGLVAALRRLADT